MNKFKKVLLGALSVLTLGLFVVTGTRVNAAGTTLYDSTTDSNSSYTKGTQINTTASDVIKLESVGMDVTVETVSSVKYLFFGTSSADGEKGFKVTNLSNEKSYEITLSLYATDSGKSPKGGDTINFGGNTATSSKDSTVDISAVIAPSEDSMLYVSTNNRRMLLKTVSYEEKTTYSISYNANGHGTAPSTVSNVSSLNETLLASIQEEGYIFGGWYFDAECTNEATVTSNLASYVDNGVVTLYAKWTLGETYTVTFVSEGSTYATETIVVGQNDNKVTNWPADPVKLGYTFDGWYNSTTKYDENTIFSDSISLTASFSKNIISIGESESLPLSYISTVLDKNNVNQFNAGKFIVHEADGKSTAIQGTANGGIDEINFNNNNTASYVSFSIPANSIAKVAICGRSAKADNTSQLTVKNGSTTQDIQFESNSSYKTHMVNVINSTSEDQFVYVYRSNSTGTNVCSLNVKVVENVDNIAKNALVNIDAEMNTDKSVLRLITTISGVELANIESIELVLLKDGVATNEPVYVSTVYSSVSGAADLYEEATNTYFAIAKITKAQSIKNSVITMSVIVTYTGDVTCTSFTKTFTVPAA